MFDAAGMGRFPDPGAMGPLDGRLGDNQVTCGCVAPRLAQQGERNAADRTVSNVGVEAVERHRVAPDRGAWLGRLVQTAGNTINSASTAPAPNSISTINNLPLRKRLLSRLRYCQILWMRLFQATSDPVLA
ncbi:hypothetical protein, partial [Rhodococcus baikonurensis]